MATGKRAAADDSSSEYEINLDKMIETKDELSKIRKDREAKRAQLQKDLDKRLTSLSLRIKQTVEAHTQQLGDINKQQINRLEQAIEARDEIEQLIKGKLVELQREGNSLVAVLDRGYEYRLEKAKSLVRHVSERKPAESEVEPLKKVRISTSSS